jgi:hypothetical protein
MVVVSGVGALDGLNVSVVGDTEGSSDWREED